MAVKLTPAQVRALMKKAAADKALAAPGPMGACVVTRPGVNTKDVCAVLTRAQCEFLDTELQAKDAGSAAFFEGKPCVS